MNALVNTNPFTHATVIAQFNSDPNCAAPATNVGEPFTVGPSGVDTAVTPWTLYYEKSKGSDQSQKAG